MMIDIELLLCGSTSNFLCIYSSIWILGTRRLKLSDGRKLREPLFYRLKLRSSVLKSVSSSIKHVRLVNQSSGNADKRLWPSCKLRSFVKPATSSDT